jgi:ribose transport system substrate-binding protein
MAAGKAMGWNMHLYDTKGDVSQYSAGIRQAVAAGASGIVTYAMDCPLIKAALLQAKNAHIPITTAESTDCASPLYSSIVSYTQGTYPQFFHALGEADIQVLAATQPNAKIIALHETDIPDLFPLMNGFDAGVKKYCPGCQIVEKVPVTLNDFGNVTGAVQKVSQALVQHPEATAIWDIYDSFYEIAIGPALRTSGRGSSVYAVFQEGAAPIMSALRSGVKGSGVGVPTGWEGYSTIDNLNRAFHGMPPANSGIGLEAFDNHHNVAPQGEPFQPPTDYTSAYLKAWGVQ